MMRTIVIRVDVRAARGEQRGDVAVDLVDDRFGEEAARHARLVRHHDDAEPARFSARMASMVHGIERDALQAIEIADLLDDRAVAIEEHGAREVAHSTRRVASSTAPTVTPVMQA